MTDHSKPCQYSTRLIKKLKSLDTQNTLDFDLIDNAVYWAKKYHNGQYRKSGEPFYSHPLEVAYMVSDHLLQTNTIVASILHDIVEDTEVTAGMIVDEFGWRIAEMVDMLTRDRPDGTKWSVAEVLNNAYEQNDKEVLLIKCCDRLHNLQTIKAKSPEKIKKTTDQTIEMFVLLSIYLENHQIENMILQKCCDNIYVKTNLQKVIDQSLILESKENYDTSQLLSQVFESETPRMYKILAQE